MEIYEFNDKQLDRLSEFFANLSIVVVASLIIPNLFGANQPNMVELSKGIVLSLILLILSLVIIRRIK